MKKVKAINYVGLLACATSLCFGVDTSWNDAQNEQNTRDTFDSTQEKADSGDKGGDKGGDGGGSSGGDNGCTIS